MYYSGRTLGSMVLDIFGDRLDAVFIDVSGSVVDYFSISKGGGQSVNVSPMFTSSPATRATQGTPYDYDITAFDPDPGDALAITSAALPAWLSLTDNGDGTATLSATPTATEVGNHAVSLVVTDASNASDVQNFTITISDSNNAPAFTSPAVAAVAEGEEYLYLITTADPDLDAVSITATTLPAWLNITDNGDGTATLSGTPAAAEIGSHAISLTVTDGSNASDVQNFTIVVSTSNSAPVFTSPAVTGVAEGQEYLYMIATADPDFDAVNITATTLPAWLALTDNGDGTGALRGTATGSEVGNHPVGLQVRESARAPGLTANQQFTLRVTAAPTGPVIFRPSNVGGGGGGGSTTPIESAALLLLTLWWRRRTLQAQ